MGPASGVESPPQAADETVAFQPPAASSDSVTLTPEQADAWRTEPAPSPDVQHLHIPGYEVLEEIGRGGMGVVYKARQLGLNRLVALKMVLDGAYAGAHERARFQREAEAVARLQHPNIVEIYDVGEHEGQPFLALEYVDGPSLAAVLAARPLPPRDAARLVEALARAVHEAHRRGIVHRDIKPANVLLQTQDDQPPGPTSCPLHAGFCVPKIADFGLAKYLDGEHGKTQTGSILGTPGYMAPEQAAGQGKGRTVGPATDVYALGTILYECLTGRPPFHAETALDTMLLVVNAEPEPPRRLQRGLPRDLETICLKCLQKEPGKRYASAQALADDLAAFQRGEPVRARRASLPERAYRLARRRPVAAGLVALLLVGLAWAGWEYGPSAYRLATNQGQLAVEGVGSGGEVVVRQDGETVATLPLEGRRWAHLPAGTYDVELAGAAPGLELSAEQVTLGRNGREVLQVGPRKEGEIRHLDGHNGPVRALAISPDGRLAVSGGGFPEGDRSVRLWNLRTGEQVRLLADLPSMVEGAAFSSDGRRVLCGCQDGIARVWDVAGGEEVARLVGHRGQIWSVAFAPDGRRALTGGNDGSVRLWDVETGKHLDVFDRHTSGVPGVAFSPDGRLAASASSDMTVRIWDLDSGEQLHCLRGHTQGAQCVAFSPDGRHVLSGGFDRVLWLWDAVDGKPVRRLVGHAGPVWGVAFAPDGRHAATASADRTVRVWEVESGGEVYSFGGHGDGVACVAFDPRGGRALSAGGVNWEDGKWARGADCALRLWGLPGPLPAAKEESPSLAPELRRLEGTTSAVYGLAASADSRLGLTGDGQHFVRLWDLVSGKERGRLISHTGQPYGVVVSADGRRALTAAHDRTARLWDLESGKELLRLQAQVVLWDVALSPDGRQALTAGDNGRVELWNDRGVVLRAFQGHTGRVRRVLFTPDGRRALSCATDKTVRVWDLKSSREVLKFTEHTGEVLDLALSPDGRQVLSGGADQTVRLWDIETGQELLRFEGHAAQVERVVWSLDGSEAASADAHGLVLRWDTGTGRERSCCVGHRGVIRGLAWLDSGRLLTGGWDGTIRLWGPPGAAAPAAEPSPPRDPGEVHLCRHRDGVASVAYSADGRYVLSGGGLKFSEGSWHEGADFSLRLWDAATGREVRRFVGHTAAVMSVALFPDGKRALSGSQDKTVRLWDVDSGRELHCWKDHEAEVRSVACSPDGKLALSGCWDKTVRLWDVEAGKLLRSFEVPEAVWSVAFSPDSRRLLCGTGGGTVWQGGVDDKKLGDSFRAHAGPVRTVAFSPDGGRAFTCGDDGAVRQWDLKEGRQLPGILPHPEGVLAMSLSGDARRLATACMDKLVRLWDTESGRELARFRGNEELVHGVALTRDGGRLASAGVDRSVRLWRPSDGKADVQVHLGVAAADPRARVTLLREGKAVLGPTADRWLDVEPGTYDVRPTGPGDPLRSYPSQITVAVDGQSVVELRRPVDSSDAPEHRGRLEGHTATVRRAVFSPDGRHVLSTGWDRSIRLWDLATRKEVRRFVGHTTNAHAVSFAPDGRTALTCGDDRSVRLWDVATGRELRVFLGHTQAVWYVAFTRDGKRALSCGIDRTIRMWDVATAKELKVFEGHAGAVECADLSPDGRRLVSSAQDGTVRLWDVETAREEQKLLERIGNVFTVAFSKDGGHVLTSGSDRTVRLLNVRTGSEERRFTGHTDQVPGAAFSPDGRRILSCSFDGTLRLWDAETGAVLHHYVYPGGGWHAAFDADGRRALSSGGPDCDIHLWSVPARGAEEKPGAKEKGR
jgi:WD40 repeat protein